MSFTRMNMSMLMLLVLVMYCHTRTLQDESKKKNDDNFTAEEMWKVIENGDKARESKKLPIDGLEDGERIEEGDMLIHRNPQEKRSGSITLNFDWHRKLWMKREIPYIITSSQLTSKERGIILSSLKLISDATCLIFRPYTSRDKHWLEFGVDSGCYSGIGKKYWSDYVATKISLGANCVHESIVVHEVLHALSFPHEQNRVDRDSYVKVNDAILIQGMERNFRKSLVDEFNTYNTEYDFESIMHYTKTSFRQYPNEGHTVESKYDPNLNLGNNVLSKTDIIEINRLYQCDVSYGWGEWTGWSNCIKNYRDIASKARVRICVSKDGGGCPGALYGTEEDAVLCDDWNRVRIDGVWSTWSDYSKCNSACGWGLQTKTRKCNSPNPTNGGKDCPGSSVQHHVCRNKRCSGYWSPLDVFFDTGFGNWQAQSFIRRSGRVLTNSGPKVDKSGSGMYAVLAGVESSSDYRGKLISPRIPAHPSAKKCITFYYQLNGDNIHEKALSVYLKLVTGFYVNLFDIGKHQGNKWIRKAITINARSDDYNIYFEATAGPKKSSDVAIDDIYIDGGECRKGLEGCTDSLQTCEDDAKNGKCTLSTTYLTMNRECCTTCSDCKDRYTKCAEWAKADECAKNRIWMTWNCCLSCSNLPGCTATTESNAGCVNWAKSGECEINTWMLTNCCPSCISHGGI